MKKRKAFKSKSSLESSKIKYKEYKANKIQSKLSMGITLKVTGHIFTVIN